MIPTIEHPDLRSLEPIIPKVKHLRFDLGRAYAIQIPSIQTQIKKGVILNPVFEQKRKERHERNLKREQKITEMSEEIDRTSCTKNDLLKTLLEKVAEPCQINDFLDVQKNILKRWVKKTDGQFKLETIKRYVDSKQSHCNCSSYDELHDIWENKAKNNPVFWSRKKDGCHIEPAQVDYDVFNDRKIIPTREILDDDYGKNKNRNDTIENIRDKYIGKSRKHYYEHLGESTYKSPQAYRQFLEVERLGLIRKPEKVVGRGIKTKRYNADADTDLYYSFKDLNKCQKEETFD
jgi:hypothetical protein